LTDITNHPAVRSSRPRGSAINAGKRRKNEARKEKAAWRRPLEGCASTPVPIAEHIVDRHGAPMRWRFASSRATSRASQS
jgi:hypothetical protein